MHVSETAIPKADKTARGFALRRRAKRERWDKIAILFLAPWLLHLVIFTLYPLAIALYGSVSDWNILTGERKFAGLVYYAQLLEDPDFFKAIRNSFVYLFCQVPASIIGGLFVALLLNQAWLKGRMLFRGIYFLPVIVPMVVMSIVWQWMYSTNTGVFNYFLSFLGIDKVAWLSSEALSMPSIAIMKIWNDIGFYAVLFLAGLQGIPAEIVDAGRVDGANDWQMLVRIKVPMLNPVVVFSVIMGTLWGLNIFTEPFLMTGGGPLGSSLTTLLYLYQQGFIWSKIGYASAMGVVSTLMILALTQLERRLLERATF